jgi:hypothetical protein
MARYNRTLSTGTILCLLLYGITGCGGGGNAGSPSKSLLTGKAIHVFEGGACCNPPVDTPLASTVLVFHTSTSTTQVASVKTDAQGNYSVMLPAGTYEVDLADRTNEPLYNGVEPQQIQVSSNTPEQVEIQFLELTP